MADITPMDMDEQIQEKAHSHTQGRRYSKEEKLRVLDVFGEFGIKDASAYFGVQPSTIRDWHKRRSEIKASKPTETTYRKLTPEDVPDVPDTEVAETERDLGEHEIIQGIRREIAMLETSKAEIDRQLERWRRALEILKG
jgi:transposase-like protein